MFAFCVYTNCYICSLVIQKHISTLSPSSDCSSTCEIWESHNTDYEMWRRVRKVTEAPTAYIFSVRWRMYILKLGIFPKVMFFQHFYWKYLHFLFLDKANGVTKTFIARKMLHNQRTKHSGSLILLTDPSYESYSKGLYLGYTVPTTNIYGIMPCIRGAHIPAARTQWQLILYSST